MAEHRNDESFFQGPTLVLRGWFLLLGFLVFITLALIDRYGCSQSHNTPEIRVIIESQQSQSHTEPERSHQ